MDYVTSWEQIAKKEGKKEGIKEGKLKTAAAMIKKGLNLDLIAEVTGFSKQQVQKLAASGQ